MGIDDETSTEIIDAGKPKIDDTQAMIRVDEKGNEVLVVPIKPKSERDAKERAAQNKTNPTGKIDSFMVNRLNKVLEDERVRLKDGTMPMETKKTSLIKEVLDTDEIGATVTEGSTDHDDYTRETAEINQATDDSTLRRIARKLRGLIISDKTPPPSS